MSKRKKKLEPLKKKIREKQTFTFEEAVEFAIESSCAKFDETVEIALALGVDPKNSNQMVRGAVVLPNGIGRKVKVIVFAKPDKEQEAKDAGADEVGAEDLIEKIKGGWFDFDKTVATPDMMGVVGKVAKLLGPKGLMPNAKLGTVTPNVGEAVKELKAGKIDFRIDKAGIIHAPVGKVSFGKEKILENLSTLLKKINKMKPQSSKGKYLKKFSISTTMGVGIKVEDSSLKELI